MSRPRLLTLLGLALLTSAPAWAEEAPAITAEEVKFWASNIWMLLATFLVFIMHLGFATLETGLTRAKNTVNILFKNTLMPAIGILTYAAVGFNLMYPGADFAGGFFGFGGFGIGSDAEAAGIGYAGGKYTYWTDFIFQAMFAATCATIVSGAVAERVKLLPFLIFSTIYVSFAYPIVGMWHWGGGWLMAMGFHDFAGSTIVHSVGGWAALVGAWYLGPRLGRYTEHDDIAPHSLPMATMGVLLLWFGWFGFNGGSVLSADPVPVSFVIVTTSLAAAAGLLSGAIVSWTLAGKPDLGMALNGCLAGLVGITAGADVISPAMSVVVGLLSGPIVYMGVKGVDALKIDDPVSAVGVHLVCGIWGTLAAGLFGEGGNIVAQLAGIAATAAFCVPFTFVVFFALDKIFGMRVSAEEEIEGLDLGEHGEIAYGQFSLAKSAIAEVHANGGLNAAK